MVAMGKRWIAKGKRWVVKLRSTLYAPDTFFNFSWKGKKGQFLLGGWIGFLALWIVSNLYWRFPGFWLFFVAFVAIHAISFGTLKYFYKHMLELNDDLAGYEIFTSARNFYHKYRHHGVNIVFPLAFILTFACGGCYLYTNARLIPTFVLYMVYFVVMVYFSMVVYLQYMRFFWYLRMAAKDKQSMSILIGPGLPGGRLRLKWLKDMTDIAHHMRYMFASVGSLYSAAFALFCFSPAYGASITAPVFYFLWIVIAIFVVMAFFVVNFWTSKYLRQLRERVKQTYIDELFFAEALLDDVDDHGMNKFMVLLRQVCATTILNSNDFPIQEVPHWSHSVWVTVIQVIASAVTLYQFQFDTTFITIPSFL